MSDSSDDERDIDFSREEVVVDEEVVEVASVEEEDEPSIDFGLIGRLFGPKRLRNGGQLEEEEEDEGEKDRAAKKARTEEEQAGYGILPSDMRDKIAEHLFAEGTAADESNWALSLGAFRDAPDQPRDQSRQMHIRLLADFKEPFGNGKELLQCARNMKFLYERQVADDPALAAGPFWTRAYATCNLFVRMMGVFVTHHISHVEFSELPAPSPPTLYAPPRPWFADRRFRTVGDARLVSTDPIDWPLRMERAVSTGVFTRRPAPFVGHLIGAVRNAVVPAVTVLYQNWAADWDKIMHFATSNLAPRDPLLAKLEKRLPPLMDPSVTDEERLRQLATPAHVVNTYVYHLEGTPLFMRLRRGNVILDACRRAAAWPAPADEDEEEREDVDDDDDVHFVSDLLRGDFDKALGCYAFRDVAGALVATVDVLMVFREGAFFMEASIVASLRKADMTRMTACIVRPDATDDADDGTEDETSAVSVANHLPAMTLVPCFFAMPHRQDALAPGFNSHIEWRMMGGARGDEHALRWRQFDMWRVIGALVNTDVGFLQLPTATINPYDPAAWVPLWAQLARLARSARAVKKMRSWHMRGIARLIQFCLADTTPSDDPKDDPIFKFDNTPVLALAANARGVFQIWRYGTADQADPLVDWTSQAGQFVDWHIEWLLAWGINVLRTGPTVTPLEPNPRLIRFRGIAHTTCGHVDLARPMASAHSVRIGRGGATPLLLCRRCANTD